MPATLELRAPQPPHRPWWRRRPPTGLVGAAFWLALWFGLLWLLRQVPSSANSLLGWMQLLVGLALIALAVPLGLRLLNRRLLWSLRNKLILTYLLIGLAPVVLFVTLVAISAYVAAGQFSVHLADTRMTQQLDEMALENVTRTQRLADRIRERRDLALRPPPTPAQLRAIRQFATQRSTRRPPQPATPPPAQPAATAPTEESQTAVTLGEAAPNPLLARLHRQSYAYLNGAPYTAPGPQFGGPQFGGQPQPSANGARPTPQSPGPAAGPQTANPQPAMSPAMPPVSPTGKPLMPLGLPPWASELPNRDFRGLVLDGDDLFLVAIDQRRVEGVGTLTALTSLPVDSALADVLAQGLGRVSLTGILTGRSRIPAPESAPASATASSATAGTRKSAAHSTDSATVDGGTEPPAVNICDFGVAFISTMDVTVWDTGLPDNVPIEVHSRPSMLYRQLFGSSLSGIVTSYIRYGLPALCLVFALIEALALWMALRLGRAITTSVEDLYEATQRVDRGDFVHRIAAAATQPDQLGELERSFNSMTGSLQRLLIEQKEKERLQSELLIAQEVQANLFPRKVRDLPHLQLHGICRPARSVSGDYYDFLVFHHPNHPDGLPGPESGVGIALGDISGKGISAALLMATVHSAIRAYCLASEDLVYSETATEAGRIALNAIRAGVPAGRAAATALDVAPPDAHETTAGDGGKLFESPGRILALLNRHLYRSTQPAKYATLFLAHYNADTAELTYSNAGHLPPLVLGRDGRVRRLDCGGTVVGLFDSVRYDEGRFYMQPGDLLVAYSDGITEPENDFGEFGEARLMEVVARYRDQPLHVISSQVMLALDAWIGAAEQPDDITLVLARQI
jgi:sigma-B regulation protein RsbU (phosphoserine phosphatase)